jgi:hypothetical protein
LAQYFFLIYINDLPEYIKHSRFRRFADASIIYRQIKSQNNCLKLQEDLEAAICKLEKSIGPRTVPCVTPDVTGIFDDVIISKSIV